MSITNKNRVNIKGRLQSLISCLNEAGDPALDVLLEGAMIVRLPPRQFVFDLGDVCDLFLILLAGTVRVQLASSRGREVTLYRIAPGDSCPVTISCLLNQDAYPAEAITESSIEAITITQESFHNALESSPGFRRYIFNGYSTNLTNIIAKIEQLAFMPIDTRLSNILLDLHEKGDNKVTHQELAGEVGTAREVVSRRLKYFESSGWIQCDRGRITVSDRNGLQVLVKPPQCD